jgi:hypothetical protein
MIVTLKFSSIPESNNWFRGGITSGADPAGSFALVGKTITFSAPAGSCTFTQPANTPQGLLNFSDVKTQLEAAIAGLKVDCGAKKLFFYQSSGTAVVALAAVNETGRVPLGLPNNEAMTGTLAAAPGGAAPALVSVTPAEGAIYVTYNK